ncbi:MAG TPA: flagellar biosynthetic protein FliO [Candidatus Paceibacterota bacterium]|nr:flagellar biosynthetic protein FliO [Candidatus Paceibacterota bacterium]
MLLVLGLIIGLLIVLARFGRKWQGSPQFGSKAGRIDVVSRRSLGKNVSLVVVQVAQRTFLLGQTAAQMTMLAELNEDEWLTGRTEIVGQDKDQLLAPGTVPGIRGDAPRAWDAFIDHLREITVRH